MLNNNVKLAFNIDGSQRYPTDSKGNEYYLKDNDMPFLMKNQNGQVFFAKTCKGYEMIPWNHLQYFVQNEPLVWTKDSADNLVYIKESNFPPTLHPLI